MRPMGPMLPIAVAQTCAGHALSQATFFDEVLLQTLNLAVQQIVRLVDEAEGYVRHHFRWTGLTELPVKLVALLRFAAQLANVLRLFRVLVPDRQVPCAEKIAII